MAGGAGSGLATEPRTARARDWPALRQFVFFMENRVGRLLDLLRHVEQAEVRVVALSLIDSVDFVVARLLVDQTERAREAFQLHGFAFTESDVLGVQLPDESHPFCDVFTALLAAELNINYTYPLLTRKQGRPCIAVHVDDLDQAATVLLAAGHHLVTDGDLQEPDVFN